MFSLVPFRRGRSSELAQYDPFELTRSEFGTLFNRLLGDWPMAFSDGQHAGWGLDVDEKENEVVVRAELPGFDVNDINVSLMNNVLTIEAKHMAHEGKEEKQEGESVCQVRRSVTLPSGLDTDKVEATYRNGVLELHLPRSPQAHGRKIEIKS